MYNKIQRNLKWRTALFVLKQCISAQVIGLTSAFIRFFAENTSTRGFTQIQVWIYLYSANKKKKREKKIKRLKTTTCAGSDFGAWIQHQ